MNIKHAGVTIQTATELKKGKQVYLNRTQVREKKRLGKTKWKSHYTVKDGRKYKTPYVLMTFIQKPCS